MTLTTVGIDLSAEPPGTAIAVLSWARGRAAVTYLQVGASDELTLHYMHHPDAKIGIDCPFGWPTRFVELVAQHEVGRASLDIGALGPGWRREYVLRQTDHAVRAKTGTLPLSVAADRIGHTALRLAALLSSLGPDIDQRRDGSGSLVEVYPAGALKIWQLPFRGYKGSANARTRSLLLDELMQAAPWLDLGTHEAVCRASDHALDAVVCALVTACAVLGQTDPPPDVDLALMEGWIHLPNCGLTELGSAMGGVRLAAGSS
jgi:hypothetical protein